MESFSVKELKIAIEKKETGQKLNSTDLKYLLWNEYKGSQSRLEQDYNDSIQ